MISAVLRTSKKFLLCLSKEKSNQFQQENCHFVSQVCYWNPWMVGFLVCMVFLCCWFRKDSWFHCAFEKWPEWPQDFVFYALLAQRLGYNFRVVVAASLASGQMSRYFMGISSASVQYYSNRYYSSPLSTLRPLKSYSNVKLTTHQIKFQVKVKTQLKTFYIENQP